VTGAVVRDTVWVGDAVVCGTVTVADTVVGIVGIVVGVSVLMADNVVRGISGVWVTRGVMGTSTSPEEMRDV
jgi:hypothetical protein